MTTVTGKYMNTREVAELFECTPYYVDRWRKSGQLPVVMLGPHSVRFLRQDVMKLWRELHGITDDDS